MKTKEQEWFQQWTPEVRALLEPYQSIASDVALRPLEIQESLEYLLCCQVLRSAMRHNPEAWRDTAGLLTSGQGLKDTLGCLFGDETPPTVAAMALTIIVRDSDEHDEGQSIELGRRLRQLEAESERLDLPQFVWVVRIVGRYRMTASAESRARFKDKTVGLVRVVDAR